MPAVRPESVSDWPLVEAGYWRVLVDQTLGPGVRGRASNSYSVPAALAGVLKVRVAVLPAKAALVIVAGCGLVQASRLARRVGLKWVGCPSWLTWAVMV